jgi:DNA (cytosine-5)-methyltransferase 1
MLRTPSVTDSTGGAISEKQARLRNRMVKVADQAAELAHVNGLKVSSSIATSLMPNEKMTNLPTPVVADAYTGDLKSGQQKDGSMHSIALPHAIAMLPTPTTQDGKNNAGPSQFDRNTKPLNVEAVIATTTNWGRFEPAIRRWEATLGRPAPLPTKADGKDGNHRLSSKFTEWMMGLPEGWVTDVGLKRNDELKACGNGVVPQQAELALRGLLKGLI